MSDTEKEATVDLEASAEERQEYYAYLGKLYEEEGNLTLPLMLFKKEVMYNYERIKREYASEQAILGQHKDIGIHLDALENAMDSLDVESAALFGAPGVVHTMYTRKQLKDDKLVRRLICGEEREEKQRVHYKKLMSIKKLVEETMGRIFHYLEGSSLLDLYEDSQEMDLYSCLHRVTAPTCSGLMRTGWRGRSVEGGKERYDVFISHAGEDKRTVAIPLQVGLSRYGIKCFLDIEDLRPGDLGWASMIHAMKTAPVGVVILSPEFAAKRWPMTELNCFLERRKGQGVSAVVVPMFYRLEREDCGARVVSEEVEMFERLGFFERVRQKETSEQFVGETLREVRMIDGIENEEGAGNWNSEEMKDRRERLINRMVDRVRSALKWYMQKRERESEGRVDDDANRKQRVAESRQYYY